MSSSWVSASRPGRPVDARARRTADTVEPLDDQRAQHAGAIPPGVEVALAVDPRVLEARDLDDLQPRLGDPGVDDRLDLEAVAPLLARGVVQPRVEVQAREAVPPEGVVAVAEIGVPGAEQHVDRPVQPPVAPGPHGGDVAAAAP